MFKNVLLLYKKSAYKIYFQERKASITAKNNRVIYNQVKKFKKAHDEHYHTLKIVTKALIEERINFTEYFRGQRINYNKYDLIITVGGDGTFLEAAQFAKGQVFLGVNSALSYSTGSFCIANAKNFPAIIRKLIKGKYKIVQLERLRLKLEGKNKVADALNDILICHENPAMMSRYILMINGRQEEQRSSGIWIATASGSSGALYSAGGKRLPKQSKKIQYVTRELYPPSKSAYRFKRGMLSEKSIIKIMSLMRQGVIYVDGAHSKLNFDYGRSLTVKRSPKPIKTIQLK